MYNMSDGKALLKIVSKFRCTVICAHPNQSVLVLDKLFILLLWQHPSKNFGQLSSECYVELDPSKLEL